MDVTKCLTDRNSNWIVWHDMQCGQWRLTSALLEKPNIGTIYVFSGNAEATGVAFRLKLDTRGASVLRLLRDCVGPRHPISIGVQ